MKHSIRGAPIPIPANSTPKIGWNWSEI
ncbi:unnamed protein product, partial [Rotaria magnacalcarata]